MTAYFRQNVIYKTEKIQTKVTATTKKRKSPVICIQTVTGFPPAIFYHPISLYPYFFSHAFFLYVCFPPYFRKVLFQQFPCQFLRLLLHHIIHIPSVAAQQFVFYLLEFIVKLKLSGYSSISPSLG